MSCMRYMITIEVPCFSPDKNFTYSHKLKSKFENYDQFVEEVKMMIDSGELRRMVEGMTKYNGGAEEMRQKWDDSYTRACEVKESK
jgi:predicted RNA-binding protein